LVGTLTNWFSYQLAYVAIVDSSIGHHFDNGGWILLPAESVIERFRSSVEDIGGTLVAMRGRFPDFSDVRLIMTRLLSF